MKGKQKGLGFICSIVLLAAILVFGSGNTTQAADTVTREEWVHILVDTFQMKIEDGLVPDDYYKDISQTSSAYYQDIMTAVNFGVIDLEAGEKFNPKEAATREFAAQTLDFCLGYELDSDAKYTMGDYDALEYAKSAQVALNQGWFSLIGGDFKPDRPITAAEKDKMAAFARKVLSDARIDENHNNVYEFAPNVVVIPEDVAVELGEEHRVTIYGTTGITLSKGDTFAVFSNGIAYTYQAVSISAKPYGLEVETKEADYSDTVTRYDAEGVIEADLGEFVPASDDIIMDVEYEEQGEAKARASKSIKDITLSKPTGGGGTVKCNITSIQVNYRMDSKGYLFSVSGKATASYTLKGKKSLTVPMGYVNIAGVGKIKINIIFSAEGSATISVSSDFEAGIENVKGSGLRKIKNFSTPSWNFSAKAELKAACKVSFEIAIPAVASGDLYAEIGVKSEADLEVYLDGKKPASCMDLPTYLYATAGYSVKILGRQVIGETIPIYTESNSPLRVCFHIEDGKCVSACSRPGSSSRVGKRGYYTLFGAAGTYGSECFVAPYEEVKIFEYQLDEDGNATITKYRGNVRALAIPEELDGHSVKAIGENVFKENHILRSVLIPDTVIRIGACAFSGCSNLETVALPGNLEALDWEAFGDCVSLSVIEIPKSLTECHVHGENIIGRYDGPFYHCSSLWNIIFENGTKKISKHIFAGCTGLKKIAIPETVTVIEEKAFAGCTALEEITIPEKVTEIKDYAFDECKKLASVKMGNGVTRIGGQAFSECTELSDVVLSKNLVELGWEAFGECVSLMEIEIPKSLTECHVHGENIIGRYDGPFYHCVALEKITFENGIRRIAKCMFAGCTGLKKIAIPETVTAIEEKAFAECTALEEITIPENVTEIKDYAFDKCKKLASVKIGNGVTRIGGKAFSECSDLSSVKLSKNLVDLGWEAFGNCVSLTEIEIPKSLTECHVRGENMFGVYDGPFYHCSALENITFENGTKQIAKHIFAGCTGLKKIALPDTAAMIGQKAFADCTSLEAIEIHGNIKTIGNYAFDRCEKLRSVSMKDGISEIGGSVFANCTNLESVKLPGALEYIADHMFYNCKNLKSIELPDTIQNIYACSFADSGIKEIRIPERTSVIYAEAFKNSALEKAVLSDGVETVQNSAFYGCADLKELIIGNRVKTIGESVFYNCDMLSEISIPDSVTSMGKNIFAECDRLAEVTLGTGLTVIPSYAFHQCQKLTEITLPFRITTVRDHAFTNCVNLTCITVPRATTVIDASAFSYPQKMTMYGVSGTYAQTYANETGITFVGQEKKAQRVTLSDTDLILNNREKASLGMTVEPSDFTDEVVWKSTDPSVVEVDDSGAVTAKGTGTATIKVTVGDCSASCRFTVIQPVTQINLNKNSLEMHALERFALRANVMPDHADNKEVIWISSDEKVVSVDEDGMVTAKAKGAAEITAQAAGNSNVKASCKVTVKNNGYIVKDAGQMESPHHYENGCSDFWIYTIDGASALRVLFDSRTELEDGFDFLYIYDGNGTQVGEYTGNQLSGKEIVISGDTVKVQLVSDDGGTAWGFKVADIQEESGFVKEKQMIAGTVSYTKEYADEEFELDARLEKGNGTLFYESADDSIASVDETGTVYINGAGTTTIKVTASETNLYSEAVMEIQLTVNKSEVYLYVKLDQDIIHVGEQTELEVSTDSSEIRFYSEDENIAVVDENGIVTGKGAGTVLIQVTAEGDRNYNASYTEVKLTVVDSGDLNDTRIDIAEAKVTMQDLVYTGKELTVNPLVVYGGKTLVAGMDYELIGPEHVVDTGTYVIKIQGIGAYKGVVGAEYKVYCKHRFDGGIVSKEPSYTETGTITYTCQLCGEKKTGQIPVKKYYTVPKPSVSKVKSFKAKAGKKKLTLSWKKVSGAAGYQIQISTKSNFKGAKGISVAKSKNQYIRNGLKAKKKYYVRIRAYKTYRDANGKTGKVYGKWVKVNKRTK